MSGNEAPRISDGGEWVKQFAHREIKDAFDPLQPTESFGIAGKYSDLSAEWEAGVEVFSSSIRKSIAGAWEGPAADAALDAVTRYAAAAQELIDPMTRLSSLVFDAAENVLTTRNAIPEVPDEKPWWHKDSWPWVGIARDDVIKERAEQAQDVMRAHYVQPFLGLDTRIPVLPIPVDPADPLDIGQPGGPGYGPALSGGSGSSPAPAVSDPSGVDSGDPNRSPELSGEQSLSDRSASDQSGSDQPVPERTVASASDSATTPAGAGSTETGSARTDPNKFTRDSPAGPTGAGPAGSGPTGATPAPTRTGMPGTRVPGAFGGAGGNPGGSGRGVSGPPAALGPKSGAAAAASTTAASTPGRGSAGPHGYGAPAAGRGKSDEDSTRTIPDYLINQDNADELIGELPKALPDGVIGGDWDAPPQQRTER
ncbi:hypothetical protein ACL02S_10335 [Nocardia sp. 004]|uniref:WXG100 family type VII secretion target n=1 Tax=Nocardia sp. 004 TaxID=3385978 RepID=UPI0039A09651